MAASFAKDIDYQGFPAIHLRAPSGAEAILLRYGGHLVSWKPAGGEERLYMSDKAVFKAGTPIRGGVPVCFPQFGQNGPLPQHGFVRTRMWEKADARTGEDFALATVRLCDDAETRAMWPHPFKVELTVCITDNRLDIEFELENTGNETLSFVLALHTYMRVREVEQIALEGLHGLTYRNMLNKEKVEETVDTGVEVTIDRETTRLYYDVTKPMLLRDSGRSLGIHNDNLPNAVVWNPWEQVCATIADMPASGFRHMICVEGASVKDPVALQAGMTWSGRQTLVAL